MMSNISQQLLNLSVSNDINKKKLANYYVNNDIKKFFDDNSFLEKKLLKSECYLFTDIKEIKTQDNNIDDYLMKFSFFEKENKKNLNCNEVLNNYKELFDTKSEIEKINQSIHFFYNKKNELIDKNISLKSLIELLRFYFSINVKKSDIYINHDGFFVAYLKVGKNSTSLVFCDNGEIIFSCNNRDLGISRISGTMTLSRNKALKKIEKIFSCLD